MLLRCTVLAFVLLIAAPAIQAGTIYKVTSKMGDKTVTYDVRFGGTRLNDHMTAFDPQSKKFVYLTWPRRGKKPEPAATIWDHTTGKNVELYKFPGAKNPLPTIPSINDMKVCPMTGDKAFKKEAKIAVD